jgi:hypothetical protein
MAASGPSRATDVGRRTLLIGASATVATIATLSSTETKVQVPADPLASWNDGPAKQVILDFVRATTERSGNAFVVPGDRIATFDQDGTLWTEHPLYTQAMFALYRVNGMAPQHPEFQTIEPFKSVLTDDRAAMARFTERAWFMIIAAIVGSCPAVLPVPSAVASALGYKMAEYLRRIELVESFSHIEGGRGGFYEDNGYEWYAGI